MLPGDGVAPILVLGSPRSGTTLVGNFIGSSPEVYNVGEYRALFATTLVLPPLLEGFSPPEWAVHRARYLDEVQQHAKHFVQQVARQAGCRAYCDSSPRNVLVAEQLAAELPSAVFVLMLRHYSGVLQSLARSGWSWAGPSWRSRAQAWVDAYEASAALPPDRTIAVSYDHLCAEPKGAVRSLRAALDTLGLDSKRMDAGVLGESSAQSEAGPQATIIQNGVYRRRPSFDPAAWSKDIEDEVAALVRPVEEALRARWPSQYRPPLGWEASH